MHCLELYFQYVKSYEKKTETIFKTKTSCQSVHEHSSKKQAVVPHCSSELLFSCSPLDSSWVKRVISKLLRLNQPQAKFHLKLDSNRLLIGFFDLIPAAGFTCCNDWI